ncbi:MAG: NADP-dependent malic enzyme [Hyphomonadaceae bacterium]|nr:NADP-dependent malic enzyme [Clostridia bacterium]
MMSKALDLHAKWRGKFEVASRVDLSEKDMLALAYTPGVAEPCMEIHRDKSLVNLYTRKWNTVAVVSDGTAVLGLGDIGPEAGLPVMEGKAILFKAFADVDAFPICLATTDTEEIIKTVKYLEPSFGGINLEDIAAPRCFEIEKRLKAELDIPVFHDDQHGTAIVTLAALINALKVVDKKIEDVSCVISGAGAAGCAIAKLLIEMGLTDIVMCDKGGALCEGDDKLNTSKQEMAKMTNRRFEKGTLAQVIVDKDIFIGVSAPGVLTTEMVKTMRKDAIVLAMANPIPEIYPDDAKAGGARIVGTGRSDYPNQVNNVLAFPGIFRGALDTRAKDITEGMKIAAAKAIAGLVPQDELHEEYVLPKALDKRVAVAVAQAVAQAARDEGVARV